MTDVVIIGAGPAGCSAAIEVAAAGGHATLIESTAQVGGNAAISTGYLAFADTSMQREHGIFDSPAMFVQDMRAEVDRQRSHYAIWFDENHAVRFAEESRHAFEFLLELGFQFTRFIPRPRQHTVDRMVVVDDVSMFRNCFDTALRDHGVKLHVNTRAIRLKRDSEGRVCGVVTRTSDGSSAEIDADRGVILAAGGYQGNFELRRRYQPDELAALPYFGLDSARGDGHIMGSSVGGDLANMAYMPLVVMAASAFVEDAIAVDESGQRFHDEAGPYGDRVTAFKSAGSSAFYIFDQKAAAGKATLIDQMPGSPVSGPTLTDIAKLIGIPEQSLERTVTSWNASVVARRDAEFGRVIFPRSESGICEPPFYAIPMRVGINMPGGGFRTSLDYEVLDPYGTVVAGLWAIGDCASGTAAAIGLGGLKLSPAVVSGRVAARSVMGLARSAFWYR